ERNPICLVVRSDKAAPLGAAAQVRIEVRACRGALGGVDDEHIGRAVGGAVDAPVGSERAATPLGASSQSEPEVLERRFPGGGVDDERMLAAVGNAVDPAGG